MTAAPDYAYPARIYVPSGGLNGQRSMKCKQLRSDSSTAGTEQGLLKRLLG
jgi:hypothetical protein